MISTCLKNLLPEKVFKEIRRQYYMYSVPTISYENSEFYNKKNKFFHFFGSYQNIGRQIARSVDIKKKLLANRELLEHINKKKLNRIIDSYIDYIKDMLPSYHSLLEGFCLELKDFHLREIFIFNLFPVLPFEQILKIQCSSAYFQENNIFLQNLDLGLTNETLPVYLLPDEGPAMFTHFNAPYIWFGAGINQFGCYYGGSSVNVTEIYQENYHIIDLPTVLIGFYLLHNFDSIAQLIDPLSSLKIAPSNDGMNLIVGSFTKNVHKRVEKSRHSFTISDDSNDLITTNHFRCPKMAHLNRNQTQEEKLLLKNSIERLNRHSTFLSESKHITKQDIIHFARNKKGDGAWCRAAIKNDMGYTTATYLYDLNHLKCHYALGFPQTKTLPFSFDLNLMINRRFDT